MQIVLYFVVGATSDRGLRRRIRELALAHQDTLARKRAQTLRVDDYGDRGADLFLAEIEKRGIKIEYSME